MGIPWLQLIDFDRAEESNLASQGYLESDLGRPKAEAASDLCLRINSQSALRTVPQRFRRSTNVGNVIFCCIDKIDTRRLIWEALKDRVVTHHTV